jgi:hypothetical protein
MNVYGKITVISNERVKNKVYCLCECGNHKWINIFNLKKGDVKSCGCLRKAIMKTKAKQRFSGKQPKNFKDYTGKIIGRITVLKRIQNLDLETWYLVKCECGTEFESRISSLRRSKFEFCRCGYQNHPLKRILRSMIDRCSNVNNQDFKWYGSKGIQVHDQWVKYPIKFIEWSLSNGWKKGLTIDRKNSEANYSPDNCQWITRSENARKAAIQRWALKNSE